MPPSPPLRPRCPHHPPCFSPVHITTLHHLHLSHRRAHDKIHRPRHPHHDRLTTSVACHWAQLAPGLYVSLRGILGQANNPRPVPALLIIHHLLSSTLIDNPSPSPFSIALPSRWPPLANNQSCPPPPGGSPPRARTSSPFIFRPRAWPSSSQMLPRRKNLRSRRSPRPPPRIL